MGEAGKTFSGTGSGDDGPILQLRSIQPHSCLPANERGGRKNRTEHIIWSILHHAFYLRPPARTAASFMDLSRAMAMVPRNGPIPSTAKAYFQLKAWTAWGMR